ncbi:PepSY-associated TM helix domain-containing protein [Pseudomonas psychrophila]|uniref:PepSY domain-containing protein n=1 Tax=Pseudomonas psychrophila TaxID=122355 RepID=A0A8I1FW14_9PSED|nr:PepSY-associated TM helix domain-containing protein [Pseudomonas psychrophila]MBJ2257996.1 PepSY domain-containing protein [Pseudomonas psychrophila]
MKQTLTQSMAWLHTWGGLIVGWLLFVIFLTGSLAVFDQEIDNWMTPELPAHHLTDEQAAQRALDYLQAHKADAKQWGIRLPYERSPQLQASTGGRRDGVSVTLDPDTGEVIPVRESVGGRFFFLFHFTLHMPRMIGIYLVGALAMGMLAALVSGIVIHKKFFKEFFTFRPAKGQRSWLDAHNASAVLLLPFHLMITYSGLAIFLVIYMPAAMDALFDGNREAFFKAQDAAPPALEVKRPATVEPAPLVALGPLLTKAREVMGPLSGVNISNPGQSNAEIQVRPILGNRIALTKGQGMRFDGVTGEQISGPTEMRPTVLTHRVISGLHFAQFGGYPMRWLYFVCGLISSAMIASGLVLFTVKRRRKYASESRVAQVLYRVVEALNITAMAGLSLACISLLWGNRLLPSGLAERADAELNVFFGVWALSLVHALIRPRMQAWREQLGLAGLMCLALPLLSMLTVSRPWALPTSMGVELTAMALGALFLWACWKVSQPAVERVPRKKTAVMAEVN